MNENTRVIVPNCFIESVWVTMAGLQAVVIKSNRFPEEPDNFERNYRCGYVGVPNSSKLFGKCYSEQLDCITQEQADNAEVTNPLLILTAACRSDDEWKWNLLIRRSLDVIVNVSGGLTYSGGGMESKYPIESNLWWFGYDCGHIWDVKAGGRSLEFCIAECETLATQLAKLSW